MMTGFTSEISSVDELAQTLREWAEINSGSTNPQGLATFCSVLLDAFSDLEGHLETIFLEPYCDLDGAIIEPGHALRFKFRPEAPIQILMNGHMDTVYPVDSPFQTCTFPKPGIMNGPGVTDMKGGLLVLLESLRVIIRDTRFHSLGGEVLITADEETGSHASRSVIEDSAKNKVMGLVFESALPAGEMVRNRKGNGTFRIWATGRSAHTGRDFEHGRNAIVALAGLIPDLHALNAKIPGANFNVGRVQGGGAVNVVPDSAEIYLNVRLASKELIPEIECVIRELVDSYSGQNEVLMQCEGAISRPPKIVGDEFQPLYNRWIQAENILNLPRTGWKDTGGSSDGNLLSNQGLPHLDGIGVHGGNIHSFEEFIILESIPQQVNRILQFLLLTVQQYTPAQ